MKIWFQNHRYKTKKALKDHNHAQQRSADPASVPPEELTAPPLLLAKDDDDDDDDDDDWTTMKGGSDVAADRPQSAGLVFRSSSADLRAPNSNPNPSDVLRYPTSLYAGETQSSRAFQQDLVHVTASSRSPVHSTPSPSLDPGPLASALYGDMSTVTGVPRVGGASMGYYYPSYTAPHDTPAIAARPLASPLAACIPMNSLRSW